MIERLNANDEEDFELDLVREPEPPHQVPESIRMMRARRQPVTMPTGHPSVQEVLLNPAAHAAEPSRELRRKVRRLIRTQLRLAITLLAWFIGVVFAGNLAFHFSPSLAATRLGGVPLEWLFPVVVVIPLLIFLGWLYVRRATANEHDLAAESATPEMVNS